MATSAGLLSDIAKEIFVKSRKTKNRVAVRENVTCFDEVRGERNENMNVKS